MQMEFVEIEEKKENRRDVERKAANMDQQMYNKDRCSLKQESEKNNNELGRNQNKYKNGKPSMQQ